jgi:hypothetical protein
MKRILIIVFLFSSFLSAQTVTDSYSESNQDNYFGSVSGTATGMGQSFTGNGLLLHSCKFWLKKTGVPTGYIYAKLYAHTGTFGTNSKPTGSPLATSSGIDISTISTSGALITFNFTSSYTLVNGTHYVITVEYTNKTQGYGVDVGDDYTSSMHSGNPSYKNNGIWSGSGFTDYDLIFYVYGTSPVTFIPIITID